jgi:ABC-type amino acid transport substrate-binding protein
MKHTIKTLAAGLLIATSAVASAQTCKVVATGGPGSYTDQNYRMLERYNSNFQVRYDATPFNVTAIEFLGNNPEYFLLSPAMMQGKTNPRPNPPVEMLAILNTSNAAIVTGNKTTVADMADKPLNVGFPVVNIYSHVLALQLKERNPKINLIPIPPKDVLPVLKSGQLDIYIALEPLLDTWVAKQDLGLTKIAVVKPDAVTDLNGVKAKSLHFLAVWVHKNSTPEQKAHMMKCLETSALNPGFVADQKKVGATPRVNLSASERDRYLTDWVALLKKFDL